MTANRTVPFHAETRRESSVFGRCAAALAAAATLVNGGCGAKPRPDELGHVIFTRPDIPGADVPYPLPKLDEPDEPAPAPADAAPAETPPPSPPST